LKVISFQESFVRLALPARFYVAVLPSGLSGTTVVVVDGASKRAGVESM
jgi:hypothetical protein